MTCGLVDLWSAVNALQAQKGTESQTHHLGHVTWADRLLAVIEDKTLTDFENGIKPADRGATLPFLKKTIAARFDVDVTAARSKTALKKAVAAALAKGIIVNNRTSGTAYVGCSIVEQLAGGKKKNKATEDEVGGKGKAKAKAKTTTTKRKRATTPAKKKTATKPKATT